MNGIVPFRGRRRLMLGGLIAGVAGLLLTLILGIFDVRRAAFAYLVSYLYWLGIAVAALAFLMTLHVSHARWSVVPRRALEAMSMTLLPLAVLFLPVALTMKSVFVWVAPSPSLGPEALEKLHWRTWYLNIPFFLARAVLYLGSWAVVAWLLYRSSLRQDQKPDLELVRQQRRLSGGALPWVGLALTFAAYDWIMSLSVELHSEILGLYYFAGSITAALALLILLSAWSRADDSFGRLLKAEHFHSMGKLLFAFVAFWAWMAYSQFMLIWIAHLPDAIPFFVPRFRPAWGWLGALLIAGQFGLPFFLLLSRDLKRRPWRLASVGIWLLVAHFLDIYWLVIPTAEPEQFKPSFADLTALVGIGGLLVSYALWLLRGRHLVPVGDPYLAQSVRYGGEAERETGGAT